MNRAITFVLGAVLMPAIWSAIAPSDALSESEYPAGPIKMLVPYGTGGGSDQLARAMASSLSDTSGMTIDVVNKPGGAGLSAIRDFMAAPADGYTIIEHIDDASAAYASGYIDEHPAQQWTPLAIAQITFSQLYIRPGDDRFHDWPSFLQYAQEHPDELAVANVSYDGSMEQINMRKLEHALGFQLRLVSFDEPEERYEALLYGRVDALFEQPGDVRAHLDRDEMKPILTFFDQRPDPFGDVPTHKEVGAEFDALLRFRGFYINADVPHEHQTLLEERFRQAFQSDSFQTFNTSKFMHIIDSYRDTEDAIQMIIGTVEAYREAYRDMLYDVYQDQANTAASATQ